MNDTPDRPPRKRSKGAIEHDKKLEDLTARMEVERVRAASADDIPVWVDWEPPRAISEDEILHSADKKKEEPILCFYCGKEGHIIRDCPLRRKRLGDPPGSGSKSCCSCRSAGKPSSPEVEEDHFWMVALDDLPLDFGDEDGEKRKTVAEDEFVELESPEFLSPCVGGSSGGETEGANQETLEEGKEKDEEIVVPPPPPPETLFPPTPELAPAPVFPQPPGLQLGLLPGGVAMPLPAGLEHQLLPPLPSAEQGMMPHGGLISPQLVSYDIPRAFLQPAQPPPGLMPMPAGLDFGNRPWETPLPSEEVLEELGLLQETGKVGNSRRRTTQELMTSTFLHHKYCRRVSPGTVEHIEELLYLMSDARKQYEEIDLELTELWKAFEVTSFVQCDCKKKSTSCGRCCLRAALWSLESREEGFLLGQLNGSAFGGAEVLAHYDSHEGFKQQPSIGSTAPEERVYGQNFRDRYSRMRNRIKVDRGKMALNGRQQKRWMTIPSACQTANTRRDEEILDQTTVNEKGRWAFVGRQVPGYGKGSTPGSMSSPDSVFSSGAASTPDCVRDEREERRFQDTPPDYKGKGDWRRKGYPAEYGGYSAADAWMWDRKGKSPFGQHWIHKGKK